MSSLPRTPHADREAPWTTPRVEVGTSREDRLTEAGAAERFVRCHADEVRFDHRRGRWLLWQGHRWAPDTDAEITRTALAFARDWQHEAVEMASTDRKAAVLKAATRLERREALRSMLALAADLRPVADAGDGWDADPWLLGVPNGVVDLRTGTLRAGRRTDRITMATDAPYDPRAISRLWDDTLAAIVPNDEALAFLQVAAGYSITGDTRRDCWFLTQGPGRNGKGTFLQPIRHALGDYATELPAAVFDARQTAKAYDLARLPGKRFVIASEAGDTIRLHHDRIKQLTGGDALIAEQKYERSFEFSPTCKLWLAANRKPKVTDDSPAFWARVFLLLFPVSFLGRENRDLRPTLEHDPEHQAAILAWLVEGAVLYARDGLTPPATVRQATDAYEQESDPLTDFLTEACEVVAGAEVGGAELYEHYRQWATTQGLTDRERLTSTTFGRRIGERFEARPGINRKVYLGLQRRLP